MPNGNGSPTCASFMDKPVVLVIVVALDCFRHQQIENDDDHEADQEISACLPALVVVIVVALDCFPHRQDRERRRSRGRSGNFRVSSRTRRRPRRRPRLLSSPADRERRRSRGRSGNFRMSSRTRARPRRRPRLLSSPAGRQRRNDDDHADDQEIPAFCPESSSWSSSSSV